MNDARRLAQQPCIFTVVSRSTLELLYKKPYRDWDEKWHVLKPREDYPPAVVWSGHLKSDADIVARRLEAACERQALIGIVRDSEEQRAAQRSRRLKEWAAEKMRELFHDLRFLPVKHREALRRRSRKRDADGVLRLWEEVRRRAMSEIDRIEFKRLWKAVESIHRIARS